MIKDLININGTLLNEPFPHININKGFDEEVGDSLLKWFDTEAPWKLQSIKDFYESYNINLKNIELPDELKLLIDEINVKHIISSMEKLFQTSFTNKFDLTAQKILPGQRIRVHTDFGPNKQTHRILIQLNKNWSIHKGGILFFLDDENPKKISQNQRYYLPIFGDVQIFEISPKSFHAVSPITEGERYTIVYSLYSKEGYNKFDHNF